MNDNDKQAMASLYAGLNMAIVLLAEVIAETSGTTREQLAALFESEADRQPSETANQRLTRAVLLQIGGGIRSTSMRGETWDELMARLRR